MPYRLVRPDAAGLCSNPVAALSSASVRQIDGVQIAAARKELRTCDLVDDSRELELQERVQLVNLCAVQHEPDLLGAGLNHKLEPQPAFAVRTTDAHLRQCAAGAGTDGRHPVLVPEHQVHTLLVGWNRAPSLGTLGRFLRHNQESM